MSIIKSLEWRAAIKKFDPQKTVSKEDIDKLIEAANLTATSGGLQPFKMVVVSNKEIKEQLVQSSYGQNMVKDAPNLLVFSVETDIDETLVDRFVERAQKIRGKGKDELIGFSESMKAYISSISKENRIAWAKSQAYIALGTVLTVAAELKIDSCPMEGFDPISYQSLLGLKEKNLLPVLVLPIGYRSDLDVHSKEKKVRKSKEEFVLEIN